MGTDAFEISVVFHQCGILDVDTQTGCTVGNIHDVVGFAQSFQNHGCQQSLFVHLSAACLFCTEFCLGIEPGLFRILTSGSLEVELQDQEPEDDEPDTGINQTDDQHQQIFSPVGGHQRDKVQRTHLDQTAGEDTDDAEQVDGGGQKCCQYAVYHEQRRGHKQEREFNRFCDSADNGCQHDGDQQGFQLGPLFRFCR